MGNRGSQLGIWVSVCHLKRKMTEDANAEGKWHLSITVQSLVKDDFKKTAFYPFEKRYY